jgi:GNAT superfamily N-acetyltransferase
VTFSWICDVIVDEAHRGQGVGKGLMAAVLEHPNVKSTTNLLGTRDAHGLYEKFGFVRREMMRRSSRTFG